jgi:hypothetical protein
MEYWALQCVKSVEVIAPKSLREKIKETLKTALKNTTNFIKLRDAKNGGGYQCHPSNFAPQ